MWSPDLSAFQGPAYKSIAAAIGEGIASGALKPGEKLPTHRALADQLGVTVGTITRGYAEAERQNLVQARVGSGTFIREPETSCPMFGIAHRPDENDGRIDLSYSFALTLGQEQHLAEELANIAANPALMHRLLQYQPEYGMKHHRQAGKHWLEYTGAQHIDEDRILISNGGQHGFFTALLALCQRGDTILSDGLTYPGLINSARQLGLRLIGLDMDEQGSTPEALELACQRHRPRAIYLMPRLNNPTCRQMSRERVETLAAICRKHQLHIIEDDVQGCLTDTEHTTFTSVAPDISILVSSCSKALVGGLRVGYIHPTEKTFEPIANALKSSCWMIAPLPTEVASRWIASERAQQIIDAQRNELEVRHQMVAKHLHDYHFESVSSAFNVWLHLPEQWRAAEFAKRAAELDILLKPAELFAAGQYPAPQAVRFCVGGELSRERLQSGLERLAELLDEMPGGGEGLV